jgi:hypothetical protein
MLCANLQEVVSGVGDAKLLVDGPIPVSPIVVEFTGVEYGGVTVVWDAETDVELGSIESEVANPLLLVAADPALTVPLGPTDEVEFRVGYGAI